MSKKDYKEAVEYYNHYSEERKYNITMSVIFGIIVAIILVPVFVGPILWYTTLLKTIPENERVWIKRNSDVTVAGNSVNCSYRVWLGDYGSLAMKNSKGMTCNYQITLGDMVLAEGELVSGDDIYLAKNLSNCPGLPDGAYDIAFRLYGGTLEMTSP